jgi:hypothetical protein
VFSTVGRIKLHDKHKKIGHGWTELDLDITNFYMEGITYEEGETTIDLHPPDSIVVNAYNASVSLSFDFSYGGKFLHHSGSATAATKRTNAAVTFVLGVEDQKPTIEISTIDVELGSMSVDLKGNVIDRVADWIANFLKKPLKGVIEEVVGLAIRKSTMTKLNRKIQNLPDYVDIPGTDVAVDYRLTSAPAIGDSYVEVVSKGAFVVRDAPDTLPEIDGPPAMPGFDVVGKQV